MNKNTICVVNNHISCIFEHNRDGTSED